MTVTKIAQRDHTHAVIAALVDVGLTVGDGVRNSKPDGTGVELDPPCCVVHPLLGGNRFGTLDDHAKHAALSYQVSCYGKTRDQAEWVRDQTEVLLDGIEVAGRHIDVVKADFGSSDAVRDDAVGSPFFQSSPRYRVRSYG